MPTKRTLIITSCFIGAAVLWYLFRPELLFIDKSVNESFPTGASASTVSNKGTSAAEQKPLQLFSGMFHKGAHETKGTAAILQLPDGTRVLRLTNFETSNGPDVRVLLIATDDATDNGTVKNSQPIEIARLKGNIGDQNYNVPPNVDLEKYQAVTIWCNRFGVNFGTAPLMKAMTMSEPMPAGEPVSLASGMFHKGAHETKGTATVYKLSSGQRVLRLTNFETSNGPDVRVLLIASNDATDNDTVEDSMPVELGKLKGNIGDQNYDIPADLDLAKYRAVTIWCNRFSVNFGTAPLG
jgi:hypothetical protein